MYLRSQYVLILFFCCISMLNQHSLAANNIQINAQHYQQFWLWGDISTAPYLTQAQQLYILQGEIRLSKTKLESHLMPQGISVQQLAPQKIWLVFRIHHLNLSPDNIKMMMQRLDAWKNAGNSVQGIQIDFDSKTKNLKQYAEFLQMLRKKLPQHYQLSITGLLDWTNVQETQILTLLRQNINELVIQSYQGSTTIPNYNAYLKRISAMQLPFKIGLVQHGVWQKEHPIETHPNFKGYVVFLLRSKPRI